MWELPKKHLRQVIFLLKFAAMLFICAGFFIGGIHLASRQTSKTQVVRDILLMLSVTETQLRYACLPVSDLLRILCETDKLSELGFIAECRDAVALGEAFPKAWKRVIEEDCELCGLLGDIRNYLIQLGADIGATDIEGQLGCCEYYKQIFEKELVLREENEKKYVKLYPALGLMLGVSAAIILI